MGVSGHQLASADNLFGSEDKFEEKSITHQNSILDFLVAQDQIRGPSFFCSQYFQNRENSKSWIVPNAKKFTTQ